MNQSGGHSVCEYDGGKIDVNQALVLWSDWAACGHGLGYSSTTISYLMIIYGGTAPRGQGKAVMEVNKLMERLDSIVAGMPTKMKRVTKVAYLWPGTKRDKMCRLHMNDLSYDNYLGRIWSHIELRLNDANR